MQGPPRALLSRLRIGANAHPPHPDQHPDRLASHPGPVVSLHQVGALLESWLVCLLFSPMGFHFTALFYS